jgi:CBS domain-containing protein
MAKEWHANPGAQLGECGLASPVSVGLDATLGDAARVMRDADVSCVLIGSPDAYVSVLTERDLADALALGFGPTATVANVAVHNPLTVDAGATVRDAAALMLHYGVRHLAVTSNCRVIGVVSMRDALSSVVRTDDSEMFVAMVHQALTSRPECWWG